ncbi:ABC transporter substrate-binding protein [Acuticoccus sp. M5D2P5]|uniref:ABC transporter substrate-binding protein n=1 Tax=Acuticoccus kalidii TaxID=2910977 RepID=UPI001F435F4B|nr:ABC transporter substrate-binding protein [Acuticoccus kalidii]MCF3932636.1 ABC transporter substrate-binding protein [Acuticoccus kalidii]
MTRVAAGAWLMLSTAGFAYAQDVPSYYPDDYQEIIEASRGEGQLLIYSNMAQYNWAPVIEGFNKLYPWINVSTLDLESDEVFTRYYAEANSGANTAGLMVSATVDGWRNFMDGDNALDYRSAEADQLPDWSIPVDNLYTVSTDPMIIVYNQMTVPEDQRPKGIADLARIVEESGDALRGKLTTYNAAQTSFGQAIDLVYLRAHGDDGWKSFETIGSLTRSEVSSGPMLAKLQAGEYSIGYFISGIVFFPKLENAASAKIMGWNFIEDGTPLFMRQMAIPEASGTPASAKLMLDYILSQAGQTAFGIGGLTPYREGVSKDDVAFYTYDAIKEEIGEDNILLIDYDDELIASDDFIERWRETFSPK